jgi:hypothetical protein
MPTEELPTCPHFCVLGGAVNHQGLPPRSGNEEVFPGPEIPFVYPRVLALPGVIAVISSLPMENGYLSYPIGYFAEKRPPGEQLVAGWRHKHHEWHDQLGGYPHAPYPCVLRLLSTRPLLWRPPCLGVRHGLVLHDARVNTERGCHVYQDANAMLVLSASISPCIAHAGDQPTAGRSMMQLVSRTFPPSRTSPWTPRREDLDLLPPGNAARSTKTGGGLPGRRPSFRRSLQRSIPEAPISRATSW